MLTKAEVAEQIEKARSNVAPPERIANVPEQADQELSGVSFDLYHFGFSLCSNKVRAVLAELGVSWRSIELDSHAHENYHPDYVQLRLASDLSQATDFASDWNGGSSVEANGFDALVVPTLADLRDNQVVVDSLRICKHLVSTLPGGERLFPADLQSEIEKQLDAVDQTPHVALLYGANPNGDRRPKQLQKGISGEHLRKVDALKKIAAKVSGKDPRLDRAYQAKIAKELAGSDFVTTPSKMRSSVSQTMKVIEGLNALVSSSKGEWIFCDELTLADLFWGVSLIRLELLGYDWIYRDDEAFAPVAGYADRITHQSALRTAVIDWQSSRMESLVSQIPASATGQSNS